MFNRHQHRVVVARKDGGVYKAWPYVGEDYGQSTLYCQLVECLDISILECFRRAVRCRAANTLGACNRRNDGYVSATVVGHVVKHEVNHACKAHYVGG